MHAVEQQQRQGGPPAQGERVPRAVVEPQPRGALQECGFTGAQLEPQPQPAAGQLEQAVVVGTRGQQQQAIGTHRAEAQAQVGRLAGVLQLQRHEAVAQEGSLSRPGIRRGQQQQQQQH